MNAQNNAEVIKEIRNVYKLQVNDRIPDVIPVCEVNPKLTKNIQSISIANLNTTDAQVLAGNSSQEVYLVGATLGLIKDATSTSTHTAIYYEDENGLYKELLSIPSLTLTAQASNAEISLTHPIRIKFGSQVRVSNSTNVANIRINARVFYYVDEATKA